MSKRRRGSRNRLNKASYTTAAQRSGAQVRPVTAAEQTMVSGQYQQQADGQFQPLPRDGVPWTAPFGPLTPSAPYGIDPLGPTGRTPPRQYEYPVGWNIPGAGVKPIGFDTLRAAAGTGIVKDCIRVVKTELTGLDWGIVVSEDAIATAAEIDGLRKVEAKRTLREKLAPDIARARAFWERPDPGRGQNFNSWLWQGLEEVLVLDSWPIFPHMTYGNDLVGLWNLDGSKIKPLLDNLGRPPTPPSPAYQQILYGFPRGEYTAAVGADGQIEDGRTTDELIYAVREVRADSPYGYSPVENALVSINLWLKRMDWITKEFDDSAMPMALMELPESSSMNPAELRRWRQAINDQLSGDLSERMRIQLGVPGGKLSKFADNAELYKPQYDTFIVKLICSSFMITPSEIGFIEQGGLGGSSYHEGQENIQYRKMILPWCRWLQGIFNDINHRYLGVDPAVEFRFLGLEEEDEAAADAVLLARVQSGRITLNEARDVQGQAPYDFTEADEPYILARTGVTFLRGLQEIQDAQAQAQVAGAEQAAQNLALPPAEPDPGAEDPNSPVDENAEAPTGGQQANADGEDDPAEPKKVIGKPSSNAEKAAASELDAFSRWAAKLAKGAGRGNRPFAFTALDPSTARELNTLVLDDAAGDAAKLAKATASALRKAGEPPGRGEGPPRPRAGQLARLPSTRETRPEIRGPRLPGCEPAY